MTRYLAHVDTPRFLDLRPIEAPTAKDAWNQAKDALAPDEMLRGVVEDDRDQDAE